MDVKPGAASFQESGLPLSGSDGAILVETWEHWNQARGAALVPERRALELYGLKNSARHLMVYEQSEADFRVRLAGTSLFGYFGQETTGKSLKELTRPGRWEQRYQRITKLLNQPCGWWFRIEVTEKRRSVSNLYVLCLPIREVGTSLSNGLLTTWAGWPRQHEIVGEYNPQVVFSDVLEFTPFSIGAGTPEIS